MLRKSSAIVGMFLTCSLSCWGNRTACTLQIREPWGNVFGGREAIFHVTVTSSEPVKGMVVWQFAGGERTIARGEQAVEIAGDKPAGLEIKLAVPPAKEGVVIPASLSVGLTRIRPSEDKAAAEMVKPLWIFHENPFAGRTEWLKKLKIQLFDPAGKTAALFTECAIPFKEIRSVDAFAEVKDSLLIVGEGVSLKEYRGLADMMVKAAASGRPVLCLALSGGEMQMPGSTGSEQPVPSDIWLRQAGVITDLDKRLDAAGWAPDGKIVSGRMALQGDRDRVSIAVSPDDRGWAWVGMRFGEGKGRLVLCGFAIVSQWKESPTPRYLLVEVLEELEKEK